MERGLRVARIQRPEMERVEGCSNSKMQNGERVARIQKRKGPKWRGVRIARIQKRKMKR
jgi:hypothetical protein